MHIAVYYLTRKIKAYRFNAFLAILCALVIVLTQFQWIALAEERGANASSYVISYETVNDQTCRDEVFYSDSIFQELTNDPDPDLAIVSAYLAAAAYQKVNIEDALTQMGFSVLETHVPPADQRAPGMIGYSIGYKEIISNGQVRNLYVVCVRGTAKNYEWCTNFDMGESGSEHEDFALARDVVLSALQRKVSTTPESNIFWLTGHSRGAAVANLLAAKLHTLPDWVNADAVYAYTYATPNVTKAYRSYPHIFNYVNLADLVTRLPLATQWGYSRYGLDIILPNKGDTESRMKDYFMQTDSHAYGGFSKLQTDDIIKTIERYAPSIYNYYHPRWDLAGYHNPSSFFIDGLATLLMGDFNPLVGEVIVDNAKESMFVRHLMYKIVGIEFLAVTKAGMMGEISPDSLALIPFAHAHSKEAYVGYMHSLYDKSSRGFHTPARKHQQAKVFDPEPTLEASPTASAEGGEEALLFVTTLPQAINGALAGRLEYGDEHRATQVGMLWGKTPDTLEVFAYDDLVAGHSNPYFDFYYSIESVENKEGFYQAFAEVNGKRYYGEVLSTTSTSYKQSVSSIRGADEIVALHNNVSAYRVGELWGIVLSDNTIVTSPQYNGCFICFCEQGKSLGDEVTIAAYSDFGWYTLSSLTGKVYEEHWGHGLGEGQAPVVMNYGYKPMEMNGLWGYIDDSGLIVVEPQYSAASDAIMWKERIYAWVQSESGWSVLWFDSYDSLYEQQDKPKTSDNVATYRMDDEQNQMSIAESAESVAVAATQAFLDGDLEKYIENTQYGDTFQNMLSRYYNQFEVNSNLTQQPQWLIWGSSLEHTLEYFKIQQTSMRRAGNSDMVGMGIRVTLANSQLSEWGIELQREQQTYIDRVFKTYGIQIENQATVSMFAKNASGENVGYPEAMMIQVGGQWFIFDEGSYVTTHGNPEEVTLILERAPNAEPVDIYQQACKEYLDACFTKDVQTVMQRSLFSATLDDFKIKNRSNVLAILGIDEAQYDRLFMPEEQKVLRALESTGIQHEPIVMETKELSDQQYINQVVLPVFGEHLTDAKIVKYRSPLRFFMQEMTICIIDGVAYAFDLSLMQSMLWSE